MKEGDGVIEQTIETWHRCLRGELPGGLDDILADDVVFYSPIVFTPQKGKEITKLYLRAAGVTLGAGEIGEAPSGNGGGAGPFRYKNETMSGNTAALEFEVEMDGLYVNGVDLITCNDEGRISEFKVMIRPLKAINAMHARMAAMLKKMQAG